MDQATYYTIVRSRLASILAEIAKVISTIEPKSTFVAEVEKDPLAKAVALHKLGIFDVRVTDDLCFRWGSYQDLKGRKVHMQVILLPRNEDESENRTRNKVRNSLLALKKDIPNLHIAK